MPNPFRNLFGRPSAAPSASEERDSSRWVLMGLGNPGDKYTRTRHNIGFRCVDALAEHAGIRLNDKRQHAELGQGTLAGTRVVLAKPRTFMNNSGIAARYLADRFGVKPERVLVILDDMDLPLGTLRLRKAGGSGGHNGLKSINAELGTQDYPRLRIGIGRPAYDAIAHVLATFSPEEETAVNEVLQQAAEAVEACVEHGVDLAMSRYN